MSNLANIEEEDAVDEYTSIAHVIAIDILYKNIEKRQQYFKTVKTYKNSICRIKFYRIALKFRGYIPSPLSKCESVT